MNGVHLKLSFGKTSIKALDFLNQMIKIIKGNILTKMPRNPETMTM